MLRITRIFFLVLLVLISSANLALAKPSTVVAQESTTPEQLQTKKSATEAGTTQDDATEVKLIEFEFSVNLWGLD